MLYEFSRDKKGVVVATKFRQKYTTIAINLVTTSVLCKLMSNFLFRDCFRKLLNSLMLNKL